ncbi:MAG: acyltransferase, partial [Pseudomonadota bacterium]
FYASRFFRIWPLYVFCAAAASFTYATLSIDFHGFTIDNLALLGVATNGHDPLGVAWSLDIELQFYFATPLIAGFVMWVKRLEYGSAIGVLVVCFLCLVGFWLQTRFGVWTVFLFAPAFAAGYALQLAPKVRSRTAFASLIAFLFCGVCVLALAESRGLLMKTIPTPIHPDVFAMGWALMLTPFIAYNVQQRSGNFDRRLGDFSYPLYLVHFPVIVVMGGMGLLDTWAGKAAAFICAIILSLGAFRWLDQPLERLRRRWFEQKTESKLSVRPVAP